LGFVLSGISYLKAIGLGLAVAVLMDATLVRGALVPAFMRLAGRANWGTGAAGPCWFELHCAFIAVVAPSAQAGRP
ncbi:MMPL family transporter, partial [Streptomyces niveus]